MSCLEPFDENIWTSPGERVRLYGVPFETRSVVVKLSDGGLWVHSPVLPAVERCSELSAIGPVSYLVAPNKIHSLGIGTWQAQCPEARTWVSPGFPERHPDIDFDERLTDTPPSAWAAEIDQHVFSGHSFLDEVVFLHKPSRTLIITDLIQKHNDNNDAWYVRLLKRLAGIKGRAGGMARDIRAGFKDKRAARASRDLILGWDFDKLVISHGLCMHRAAKVDVERAWAWLD